ncbi:MAG: hypothetical protein M1823_006869, partial [Watsoniomyces obsoletus]
PDRIVLGPPRRSFASANARTTGKSSNESPDEPSTSLKTTFERFKNGDGESRKSQANGRHDIADEKSRRKLDEEEDTRPRRDYDRKPRWAGADDEQPQRSKLDQPWSRYSRGADSMDDTKREGTRHQDWRRDRGKDRGWDRPAPAEEDPEWMDEPMEEQAAPARTQEDFQRWKERMKAGKNTNTTTEDVIQIPASPEPTSGRSQKPAHTFVDAE